MPDERHGLRVDGRSASRTWRADRDEACHRGRLRVRQRSDRNCLPPLRRLGFREIPGQLRLWYAPENYPFGDSTDLRFRHFNVFTPELNFTDFYRFF